MSPEVTVDKIKRWSSVAYKTNIVYVYTNSIVY